MLSKKLGRLFERNGSKRKIVERRIQPQLRVGIEILVLLLLLYAVHNRDRMMLHSPMKATMRPKIETDEHTTENEAGYEVDGNRQKELAEAGGA